jgi:transposase InsO family protein
VYASYEYQKALRDANALCSMSRRGDCWDNAPMESFFGTLKQELVHRRKYWSREEAIDDLAEYLTFYNHKRRHSSLGGISPVEHENRMRNLT